MSITNSSKNDKRVAAPDSDSKHGLRNFLVIAVLLSIAFPASISGAVLIWINYVKTVEHDSGATAENYADFLEAGMITPLWNLIPDMGEPLVESVFVDNAVQSVEVFNDKGEPFLNYKHKSDTKNPDEVLVVKRDVKFNGETLGHIELTYSLERAQTRAGNEAQLLSIIIIAQLIFSVVVVSVALHKRVMLPLKKLRDAAHNITMGDFKTSIPPMHDDELGELSEQFETMRNALSSSFELLEQRVAERTEELSNVNEELTGALVRLQQTQDNLIQSEKLAALGSLVAGVAHELNTPIGNGLTVATTLQEQYQKFEKEVAEGVTRSGFERFIENLREGISLIVRNLGRASELVVSFKQVAVDQASAQRRKFSIQSLMQETILTIRPAFKRTPYKIDLTCHGDVQMDGYPGPLIQVVTNLINNAIIHGFSGRDHGSVHVEVTPQQDTLTILVEDDGNGIPEHYIHKIFEPFFTTKLGEGGSGLGLHITHNIVTGILGGKIDISSEENEGTKFYLHLPLMAPKQDATKA